MTMEYQSKLRDDQVDMLFDSILCLENREECYRFFEDLCTVNEIKSLAQRLEVAIMLRKKYTYNEIAERTGASTATISRVNRSLIYGSDGYNRILDKLEKKAD
ncbi:MAG TPA: helix-turn-helix domain-containing protein [Clostridiales bacterium]|jgi:TrpR-related protein YerC/YecD|nr:helix-turn-helix domain-containing protein [Clostridiales bacterium]